MSILPFPVEANLFSNLLGKEVLASTTQEIPEQNSQNMALLAPNVSTLSLVEEKKDNKGIDPSLELNVVSEVALSPVTGPLGVSDGTEVEDYSLEDISFYVVHKGETYTQIAEMFDITVGTILSANDLTKDSKAKEGDVLLIFPFSAVKHPVAKGQTLQGIANLYKISAQDIIDVNEIPEGSKIVAGDILMIPGGNMLTETKPKTKSNIARGTSSAPVLSGYFINPVPGARRTRGIISGKNKHKGVDLAAPAGTPIHAAAAGKVLIARNGYNGGFGNYVVLLHPNGVKTLYAHMVRLGTTQGAQVSQGEVIGYVGNTGHSFGAHLHIEVLGAKNPF